ncbi:MAG: YHS domain-containing (seleno)protein [Polyangiaceae bacterium]
MSKLNLDDRGVIAGGYDVVAYFKSTAAVEGRSEFEATHAGAKYRFANADNKRAFEAAPEKYAPAFGGFCPFGIVAMGQCAPTNPKTFRIQDGRLLLFFNDLWEGKPFDTSAKWDEDPKQMLVKADAAWPTVGA